MLTQKSEVDINQRDMMWRVQGQLARFYGGIALGVKLVQGFVVPAAIRRQFRE